jgi:DNA-directed RNA polymerase subunit N (RpoN/RPB10)
LTHPSRLRQATHQLYVSDAMNELQLKRYCCRRMVLTHVDLIEKLLLYNRCVVSFLHIVVVDSRPSSERAHQGQEPDHHATAASITPGQDLARTLVHATLPSPRDLRHLPILHAEYRPVRLHCLDTPLSFASGMRQELRVVGACMRGDSNASQNRIHPSIDSSRTRVCATMYPAGCFNAELPSFNVRRRRVVCSLQHGHVSCT